ncbi:hypothetical protein FWF74_01275 [Candidatus Saccharibacteria bacterium]|nr:hypothetical protein [Candidatus Saccharibacteria bacterium]MCL1963169.1 hypothetical protein [Candidatus Saccharibacteria bacterium]
MTQLNALYNSNASASDLRAGIAAGLEELEVLTDFGFDSESRGFDSAADEGRYYDLDALRRKSAPEQPQGESLESGVKLPISDLIRGYFRGDLELTPEEKRRLGLIVGAGAVATVGAFALIDGVTHGAAGENFNNAVYAIGEALKSLVSH